jgi:hypothetical protein
VISLTLLPVRHSAACQILVVAALKKELEAKRRDITVVATRS